jgi:ACS family glucarate transporter-like MFS transporter
MNDSSPTRVRWWLVFWIALTGAVSYLDRVNLSVAGHLIAQEFHLDNPELGLVFGAFPLGYALLQIPGGWLADRFGPRRVLALGGVWWAVFTTLTGAVPATIAAPLAVFWTVRFLLGVGEAVMYPSSNRWVANWIPTAERGTANGMIFAGVGAGAALAPPVIAAVMTHYGWRESFWMCGLLGLAVGAAWYALARDLPSDHRGVNAKELELIRGGIEDSEGERGWRVPWRAILTSQDVWGLTLSYFTYGYATWIFFAWFFIYLTTVRGVSVERGSFYTMLPLGAMSICSALGGLISDAVCRRFGRRWGRCGVAALGLGMAAVFLAIGAVMANPGTVAIIMAAGCGSIYLSQSAYWALAADLGGPSSGQVSGFINMGAQMGAALTAALTPVIALYMGWMASFFAAAGMLALGAVAWLTVDPNGRLERQPRPAISTPLGR